MIIKLAKIAKIALFLLAILVLFGLWYSVAANYDYDVLAGNYAFAGNGIESVLHLHPDGRFDQDLKTVKGIEHASGRWRRIGEGGVNFSVGFLRLPGTKSYIEEFPDYPDGKPEDDHSFYGRFEKILGIYPVLYVNGTPEAKFHKTFF